MCADFCRNWKAAKERRHEGCCWSHGLCMTVASDKKGCLWTCNIFKDLQSCLFRITASQHGQLASWSVGQLVSCDSPLCSKVLTVAMHFKLRTEHQFKYPTRIALSASSFLDDWVFKSVGPVQFSNLFWIWFDYNMLIRFPTCDVSQLHFGLQKEDLSTESNHSSIR